MTDRPVESEKPAAAAGESETTSARRQFVVGWVMAIGGVLLALGGVWLGPDDGNVYPPIGMSVMLIGHFVWQRAWRRTRALRRA